MGRQDAFELRTVAHAPLAWYNPRSVCRHRQARRGRHGRGLPRLRHEARSGCGAQGATRGVHGRPGSPGPLRAGSHGPRLVEPPQRRAHLRAGRGGEDQSSDPRTDRGADPRRSYRRRADLHRRHDFDVYVHPFPDVDSGQWKVSASGGWFSVRSRDGRELFFFAGDAVMAAAVTAGSTFSWDPPVVLFRRPYALSGEPFTRVFDVSPDG